MKKFVCLFLTLSACALLCIVACLHFCLQLCWASCKQLEDHKRPLVMVPGALSLKGYSRVPDGQPLVRAPCRQCAVVSSSGQMLGSRLGKEIDQMECVLRMNQAPTSGYEEDVGTKSSIRVVSHTSIPLLLRNQSYFFKQSRDTIYVIWGPMKKMSREKVGMTYRTLREVKEMYPSLQIYTLTERMMAYCDEVFQNETGRNSASAPAWHRQQGVRELMTDLSSDLRREQPENTCLAAAGPRPDVDGQGASVSKAVSAA
ncbi:alpha-N-acetyl-neuraminyl-2,3-beta-galactosyl-1,3-N-acetyl-galactosaminide alpha-2,6-sialyltransferase isoform X4 [Pelodiscus sinensis]|uniref:alpha-N-acetyl-neuraminyl-2,3-beta-galactosyl-1, 3-N-acetyl-galactosaminide alpha-2,6-sialyltransferase isoform X4 n=1 Tax=Pelodiscus sinensis TaxID=13735 RepID=UPI003F6D82C3